MTASVIKYTIQESCQEFYSGFFEEHSLVGKHSFEELGEDFLNPGDQVIRKGLGDPGLDPVAGSGFSMKALRPNGRSFPVWCFFYIVPL